jgi:transglutaminase superfamily protein
MSTQTDQPGTAGRAGLARYYTSASPTSDISRHAASLRLFPGTPLAAGRWARNAVVHVQDLARAGLPLTEERTEDLNTRSAGRMLDRVMSLSSAPLSEPRPPEQQIVGNCHHFALLACAFLRHAGVVARMRYGFAPYLAPGTWEDHCLVQVLMGSRWRYFDPRYALDIDDEDPQTFVGGGEAWRMCRSEGFDPGLFGSDDLLGPGRQQGSWFIRNNVIRDYASVCKVELHPWDWWGLMTAQEDQRPEELVDELAELAEDDSRWAERAARFETDPLLNPGEKVVVFSELGEITEVSVPAGWATGICPQPR